MEITIIVIGFMVSIAWVAIADIKLRLEVLEYKKDDDKWKT